MKQQCCDFDEIFASSCTQNCQNETLLLFICIKLFMDLPAALVRSSETSKNDSWTSGIPAWLVRQTAAYFWFSHRLHGLYIFQTSECCIRTSDFCNPLARRTSAFNLKFRSLTREWNIFAAYALWTSIGISVESSLVWSSVMLQCTQGSHGRAMLVGNGGKPQLKTLCW